MRTVLECMNLKQLLLQKKKQQQQKNKTNINTQTHKKSQNEVD